MGSYFQAATSAKKAENKEPQSSSLMTPVQHGEGVDVKEFLVIC